jgi:hypothetical protein
MAWAVAASDVSDMRSQCLAKELHYGDTRRAIRAKAYRYDLLSSRRAPSEIYPNGPNLASL